MTKPGSPKNPKGEHDISTDAQAIGAPNDTVRDDGVSPRNEDLITTDTATSDALQAEAERPAELDPSRSEVVSSSPTETSAVPERSATNGAASNGGSATGTVALVLSVLALASLAATGYYAWQQIENRDERLAQLSSQVEQITAQSGQQSEASLRQVRALEAEVARLRERPQDKELVESVNQQLNSMQQQLSSFAREQNQQLGQMDTRLNGQQQRLLNMSTTNREDWLLAEAEYLLRLANQRVLIERAPTSAVGLIESADVIMEQVAAGLGDPELFAIRKSIANDLTALRSVKSIDKEGIYLQLEALANSVDRLPTSPELGLRSADEAAAAGAQERSGKQQNQPWYTMAWDEVKSMAGVFDQYVRIQNTETPTKPLVDEASLQLARLNLRLALEQAQVAMLREEEAIYKLSLERAQQLVDQYFQPAPATEQFTARLESLSGDSIIPELPDISQSLQLLHGYSETLHRSRPGSEAQS